MPDETDITDWRSLATGSADQRRAHSVLSASRLFDRLALCDAALAGTFPLDIAVPGSDLDILVQASVPAAVAPALTERFGNEAGYAWRMVDVADGPALVAGFTIDGLPVEIFVHPLPVIRQMAWRHMLVEARLLHLAPDLRAEIRTLKRAGIKTEPAFAQALGVTGDPYQTILNLEFRTNSELYALVSARRSAMCQTP